MTKEEIKNLFMKGIDCSQVVTGAFAEKMGMTQGQARKVSSCFGGGMMCGETCGAVTGALMVIGMVYGHSREGDQSQKEIMAAKTGEFKKLFGEKYSSCICRELLGRAGPESPVPEARTAAYYAGRPCAALVGSAAEIFETYLAEHPPERREHPSTSK